MKKPALYISVLTIVIHSLFEVTYSKAGDNVIHVKVDHMQIPVLRNVVNNPVMRIRVFTPNKVKLKSLTLDFSDITSREELAYIKVYFSGKDSVFYNMGLVRTVSDIGEDQEIIINRKLAADTSYLWVSVTLKEDADLQHRLGVILKSLRFSGNRLVNTVQDREALPLRFGEALRNHKDDGADTYRIPGLATTSKGTLLAIYDIRWDSSRDLQGDIDVGLSRSTDGGNAWEPMRKIMDMGEWGGLPQKYNGIGDPCILVNGEEIIVFGLWVFGAKDEQGNWVEGLTDTSKVWNHQWQANGSMPGLDPKQTAQFMMVKSTDDGITWTEPVNLTHQLKKEDWWLFAPAPGNGIVMANGTLVIPTQGRDANGEPFSNISWSKDGGNSWHVSNTASHNTTECSVAEYSPGKLMLNIRDNRNGENKSDTNGRAVYTTSDLGATWEEHPSSHGSLPEPVCMAALYKHEYVKNGEKREVLIFSNPNSRYERENITVKFSLDGGITWPEKFWILLDAGQGPGYSVITTIDENTIGIVYESSRADLVFQRISIPKF
ncbi:MAG: exo-alpha-sialidase [Cyclobacteriaceae bacterium]|nr:exo-alpha-sialidase [Cyclobacteriaceae bacterium]